MTLTPLSNAFVNITVTSLNGFQGTVSLDTEDFPGGGLFVTWVYTGNRVTLSPGGSANATLFINTPSSPGLLFRGERVIWVSASASPCLNHVLTIPITVLPIPTYDFTIIADPASLTFPAGDSLHNSTITVSSINGFNGTISFQWIGAGGTILTPQNFTLHSGGTGTAQLGFYTSTTSCTRVYSIPVIASGGAIQHAVVVTIRLTDPTVSTLYFWPSGFCCRSANSTFTIDVNLHLPTGQAVNAFDVRINYTNPAKPFSKGVLQAEKLNVSSGIFQHGIVLIDCIDGIPQNTNGCPSSDLPIPGQLHLAIALLGSSISGPFDRTLFSIKFNVTGNGASVLLFDSVQIVNIRTNPYSPNLLNPEYIPVLERMGAFSSQGPVAIFDYQPSQPSGSPAQRVGQPVIFNALESFTPNGVSPHIQSYSWNFGGGPANTTAGPIIGHTYNLPGPYSVSLKITDATGQTAMLTRVLVVSRDLGNLTLSAKKLSYRPLSNVTVALYNTTSQTPPFAVQYTDANGNAEFDNLTPGTYTVTLTGQSLLPESIEETILPGWTTQDTIYMPSSTPSVSITSLNPYLASTGTPVTVTFSIYSPIALSGISINWGDGTTTYPSTTATSDTHTYLNTLGALSQIFTINVTATNPSGQGFALAQETVNDRPPTVTVTIVSPSSAIPGQLIVANLTASDPDGAVSFVSVNWGDGSIPDLILRMTSESMCQRINVNLHNDACTIPLGALILAHSQDPNTIMNNTIIVFRPYSADPSYIVVHRIIRIIPASQSSSNQITFWTEGDANGTPDGWDQPAGGISGSQVLGVYQYNLASSNGPITTISGDDIHTYANTEDSQSEIFTITATTTDNSGLTSTTTGSVTIHDEGPGITITSLSPNTDNPSLTSTVNFSTIDPDGTISSISVDWGDGSAPDMIAGSATFDTHTYARSGTFQITITATDNSGYSTRASSQWLTVSPPLSAPAAQAPTILGLAPIEFYSLIGIIAGIIVTATFLTFRRLKKPASRQPLLRLENRPE